MKLAKLNNSAEIFHTIQGEGKSMGKPSIFVRTSLCNLHCIWCDTDYTWNWEGTPFETVTNKKYSKDEYVIELTSNEVASEVGKFPCKHVVLTGGEPLMQQEELTELMALLKATDPDYTFEIETNGTLVPSNQFDQLIDQYNVSAKLSNSNNPERIRLKPGALDFFSKNSKCSFKFVISQPSDLREIKEIMSAYNIDAQQVYLMPEGISATDLNAKQKWLVNICKDEGFNYTDRLHIHIYGSKRGV